jgi:hypothetical protein
MSTQAKSITQLLVRLRPLAEEPRRANRYRRRSREEVIAAAEANARCVERCMREIRSRLAPEVEITSLPNLNFLIVSCPRSVVVEDVRSEIERSCGRVESVTEDFTLEAIRPEIEE